MEATRVSVDGWMDKQNVVYTYSEVSRSLKKERNSDVLYTTWTNLKDLMLSEVSQLQKDKYCMIPFRWIS